MPIERIPYAGWNNNLRLGNASLELIVTAEVGPRIIALQQPGGRNLLKQVSPQLGGSGETEWMIRGGHRLWAAPEDASFCYALDNDPYPHEQLGENSVRLSNPPDPSAGLAKNIILSIDPKEPRVHLEHTLTNRGAKPITAASWALTVMEPGGIEIIPQPPSAPHGPGNFLPNRSLVLWSYSDLRDPRYRVGGDFILLRQQPGTAATKFGLFLDPGWAGYLLGDTLFLKQFDALPGMPYPDMGCNFETFTNGGILEVESLGPMAELAPGQSTGHAETWWVESGVTAPDWADEKAIAAWIKPILSRAFGL